MINKTIILISSTILDNNKKINILNIINDKFCSINKYVSKHLEKVVFATMKCASASTYEIVREMCRENGKTFKTNISTIDRLFQNGI